MGSDGGGTEFQGDKVGAGDMNIVRKELIKEVTDGALSNPSRSGERGVGAGE